MNHLTSDRFCKEANNTLSQGRAEFSIIIGHVSNSEVGKKTSRDPHSSWMGPNKAELGLLTASLSSQPQRWQATLGKGAVWLQRQGRPPGPLRALRGCCSVQVADHRPLRCSRLILRHHALLTTVQEVTEHGAPEPVLIWVFRRTLILWFLF